MIKRHYGIDLWEELESYGVCVSDTRRHLVFQHFFFCLVGFLTERPKARPEFITYTGEKEEVSNAMALVVFEWSLLVCHRVYVVSEAPLEVLRGLGLSIIIVNALSPFTIKPLGPTLTEPQLPIECRRFQMAKRAMIVSPMNSTDRLHLFRNGQQCVHATPLLLNTHILRSITSQTLNVSCQIVVCITFNF